jgi:pimeloyl-ACP methyl ester carboxylesterase
VAILVGGAGGAHADQSEKPPLHVHFRAADGVRLDGRLFGAGKTAVVFSHMGNAGDSQADWYATARLLAHRGYTALTYNRRGVCLPNGTSCSQGFDEYAVSWKDVVGAYDFVRKRGARRVILVGASIGAMCSLYAASLAKVTVAGLVVIAGINHASGYDFTSRDVRAVEGRKLFVSGDRDPYGGAAAAREWYRWAKGPKRLLMLDSSAHGTDMLRSGEATAQRLKDAIVAFLSQSRCCR